ncbi:MAG TPA: signal peptidase I [Miltoncostaeaceae bacterium]|nr:signal peptidase I [Miltoncostaeaceae bacterium]
MSPLALRAAGAAGRGLAAGAVAALALATALALLAGLRGLTVLSGSMAPAIGTGDVVLTRTVPARTLAPGDVATFRDPGGSGRLITHRVLGIRVADGRVEVVTRGDANTGVERWSIAADGRVGRVTARVPRLGRALAWTRTPGGRLLTVALPLAVLACWGLATIWRPRVRA